MANWYASYHNRFTYAPTGSFVPFELGYSGSDPITIAAPSGVTPLTKRVHNITKGAGWDYWSINAAITAASNGDTIVAEPYIYYESVDIGSKQITLRGSDPNDPAIVAQTIIDPENSGSGVTIGNSNTLLDGFTIVNGYAAGVYCSAGASPTIAHCVIKNSYWGIYCGSSTAPLIKTAPPPRAIPTAYTATVQERSKSSTT